MITHPQTDNQSMVIHWVDKLKTLITPLACPFRQASNILFFIGPSNFL